MNFKKIISGIVAAAMALVMTIPTVSATDGQDTIKLTYDLKEHYWETTESVVTVTQRYTPSVSADTYRLSVEDAAIILGDDDASTPAREDVAYLEFGVDSKYFEPVAIEVTISATATNKLFASNSKTTTWSYDKRVPLILDSGIKNVINGHKFYVPISLGKYTNTLNMSAYDLTRLGYSGTGSNYGVSEMSVRMTYKVKSHITIEDINKTITNCGVPTKIMNADNVAIMPSTYGCTSFDKGMYDRIWAKPMKSSLNAPADVLYALSTLKAENNRYTRPIAVLNDAIANGSNVTFTFVSFNGMVDKDGKITFDKDKAVWNHKAFEQHLYSDIYSPAGVIPTDNYGSYSSAWGINLFEGAIVVNSNLTMQLNQVDKFTWNNDTLTFDWDTITSDGKITDAKTFLTSMLLYTPVDWYWDTLIVEVDKETVEDIAAGAGLEDESEEIILVNPETSETLPAIIEPIETIDEAVVEEPVEDTIVPVESPKTGNPAVIGLIPVAMAAAAIIAKRKSDIDR